MAKLMLWVYFILAFHTFTSRSEAHHLNPFVDAWNIPRKSLQPMLVTAKAFYHKRLELKVIKKRQMYEPNRDSLGGPEPWHHSMEH